MTRLSPETLARRIAVARGRAQADLVIRDVRLYDLTSGSLRKTDIAVVADTIVGVTGPYAAARTIDGRGRIAVPGFIDAHLHVESSLVTPLEFDRCVSRHGVTTAVCDPHEIANVLGAPGLAYMLAATERTVMDLRVNLSSCVPATHLETAGASLSAAELLPFRAHPKVVGLAEFMNFPGVVHADQACLDKLSTFSDGHIDGHAPLLSGAELDAYVAAGIRTEHESTSAAEALEKLAKGMTVFIREGSVSKDLHALAEILDVARSPYLAFCTDDRNPLDIAEEGHLDYLIRTAIALGCPPLAAYRAASLSAATAFGMRDRGLLAPGRRADIVLLDDLETCRVALTIAGGVLAEEAAWAGRAPVPPIGLDSMKAKRVMPADFEARGEAGARPVIGVIPGKIITEYLAIPLEACTGRLQPDLAADVVRVAVIERHGVNGNIGNGFVKGFGLKRGAIASSVGHDSHNVTVVGVQTEAMALAANRLGEIGGGFVVVEGERVIAELPLPIAGLMSEKPFESLIEPLKALRAAAKGLGVTLAEPFLQIAFLPLAVIPHLKITDRGMVDVDRFDFVG